MSARESVLAAPDHTDARVCGLCLRGWGSVIVTPPPGHFRLYNSKTGRFHAERRGKTACGKSIAGEEWQRVAAVERTQE